MNASDLNWYCARTKPKHEHIAAANLRKNLGIEVFNPRIRLDKATRRGVVRNIDPLFPCYIFVRCELQAQLSEIRYTNGVSTLVHFGLQIPPVPDTIIQELQAHFDGPEPLVVEDRMVPGSEVIIAEGAFAGMRALVLRVLPARQRVQILLDILSRPTTVEIDRSLVAIEGNAVAYRVPVLAMS
ncbi:MAG: transcriptional activator RfaH [Verrucomicrobiota bacterium]